jgi:UDP-N-acetylglucosamine 2-epimerase (non-hydrolysing)
MYKVLVCVGTRPNFIKVTQFEKAFKAYPQIQYILLHTGQHYDEKMNDVFFSELNIQKPDITFKMEPGGQISMITQIMVEIEKALIEIKPDLVMVPGDVNSSFACAFVANRLGIPVAHIESGLRSFDMSMPEEANRILIDHISDIHFVTEPSGITNLAKEGKQSDSVHMVGNTMIDSLIAFSERIDASDIRGRLGVESPYFVMTFHRPFNVDDEHQLQKICKLTRHLSTIGDVVFPVHYRTIQNLKKYGLYSGIASSSKIKICEPLGYLDFLHLVKSAYAVITDSGGVQEETTFLGVPCLTIRPNTERPVTVDVGSNILLPFDVQLIFSTAHEIISGKFKKGNIPEKWDGKSSERIAGIVNEFLLKRSKK